VADSAGALCPSFISHFPTWQSHIKKKEKRNGITFKPKLWPLGFHFPPFPHFVFPPQIFRLPPFSPPPLYGLPLSVDGAPATKIRATATHQSTGFIYLFRRRSAGLNPFPFSVDGAPATKTHRPPPIGAPPSLSPFSCCKCFASLFS
jgi:hypothetical protein